MHKGHQQAPSVLRWSPKDTLKIRLPRVLAILCYSVGRIFAALALGRQPPGQGVLLKQLRGHFCEQAPSKRTDGFVVVAATHGKKKGQLIAVFTCNLPSAMRKVPVRHCRFSPHACSNRHTF
jgi:hypothetical protein